MRVLVALCLAWVLWIALAFLVLAERPAKAMTICATVPDKPLLQSPTHKYDYSPRRRNDRGIA